MVDNILQIPIIHHNNYNNDRDEKENITPTIRCLIVNTHHASECEQRRLDLCHVAVLKQVVGLKDVVRLQAVLCDGFDEVCQVLQLKTTPD